MKLKVMMILAGICLLGACTRQAAPKQIAQASASPQPLTVRLTAAELRKVIRSVGVTGSLHPDETVNVSAEVPGRLAVIHADFGQRVRQGDVVAELDRQELEIQLERARAALAQALARIGLPPDQVDATPETTPAIRQAAAQLEDVRFKYENAAKLVKTGDISQERFNELEKAYRARQAAYDAARDELRTQLAAVQALRAEVKLATKRLNDATVRAPFDGAVTARLASPGQYLRENAPILTLVKTEPLRLRVEIPESAASAVRTGMSLSFETDAVPGKEFHAIVRELNPSLDPRSRSLLAEARLVERDPRLRPGMFVQVQLVTSRATEVVAVPKEALYTVAGLTKIFVVREGKASEIRLTPGQEVDGWVEVPGGRIQPGEAVAVSNLHLLVEGTPVKAGG